MARQSLGVHEIGQRIARDDSLGILWNRRELYTPTSVSMDAKAKMTTREFHAVAKIVSGPHLELLAHQARLGWAMFGNEDSQPE